MHVPRAVATGLPPSQERAAQRERESERLRTFRSERESERLRSAPSSGPGRGPTPALTGIQGEGAALCPICSMQNGAWVQIGAAGLRPLQIGSRRGERAAWRELSGSAPIMRDILFQMRLIDRSRHHAHRAPRGRQVAV